MKESRIAPTDPQDAGWRPVEMSREPRERWDAVDQVVRRARGAEPELGGLSRLEPRSSAGRRRGTQPRASRPALYRPDVHEVAAAAACLRWWGGDSAEQTGLQARLSRAIPLYKGRA